MVLEGGRRIIVRRLFPFLRVKERLFKYFCKTLKKSIDKMCFMKDNLNYKKMTKTSDKFKYVCVKFIKDGNCHRNNVISF